MKIETIFKSSQKILKQELDNYLKKQGYRTINQNGFLFAQGKTPVLLVAHLDTVHREQVRDICVSADNRIMMSPQGIGGDDRCGVYMILEIIKRTKCSILFCEDEEIGCVGAKLFCKSNIKVNNVNYIIELDREGNSDAVFYDCGNKDFIEFITNLGFKEKYGSYSDISEIAPHLGIAAVNISSGYYNAHTRYEYVDLDVLKNNIKKVIKIIRKKCKTQFEYIECKHTLSFDLSCYDGVEATKILLMSIDDAGGYLLDDNGFMYNSDDFYIDECYNIYFYDWESNLCMLEEDITATNYDGGNLIFNEKMAILMNVIL